MSLIKNLIKETTEKKPKKSKNDDDDDKEETKEEKVRPIIKSATDLQRLKLEKLMKNPEKPIIIPEQRREKDYMQSVPSFVRNVMGSSAGAGSGEFHVYRHLRRKEYARQKNIQAHSFREHRDEEFQQKLENNRRVAEEKTAQKRAKRLKKKERAKRARQSGNKKEKVQPANEEPTDTSEEEEDQDIERDNKATDKESIEVHSENKETEDSCSEHSNKAVDNIKDQEEDKNDAEAIEELQQNDANENEEEISNVETSKETPAEESLKQSGSSKATEVDVAE